MNTYRVILEYCDTLDCENYNYIVFGRNEEDALWAAKDEFNREVNFADDWFDEQLDCKVVSIEMIDPLTIM